MSIPKVDFYMAETVNKEHDHKNIVVKFLPGDSHLTLVLGWIPAWVSQSSAVELKGT